jgi:hypothetical protein
VSTIDPSWSPDGKAEFGGSLVVVEEGFDFLVRWPRSARGLQQRLNSPTGVALLLILGPSDSGKSSVVRAGLVPELKKRNRVPGVDAWRRCIGALRYIPRSRRYTADR